ncbi:thioredoxin-domain-containing protein [Cyathus striatus]|nr:thioredoxin-domain-containing protein [Cyathus striatus]
MSITHIESVSQLNGILTKSKDKLSVIDFHATWCGPCHAIAPTFEALSKQHKNVNFLKCDVDAARDVASLYSVSAMPTFIFLRGDVKVDQVRGADRAGIENALRKHASPSSAAFSGKGQTLGSTSAQSSTTKRNASSSVSPATASLNPQLKVFLGLVGLYLFFWYF